MRPGGGAGEWLHGGPQSGVTTDVHKIQKYVCCTSCLDVRVVAVVSVIISCFVLYSACLSLCFSNLSRHFLPVSLSSLSQELWRCWFKIKLNRSDLDFSLLHFCCLLPWDESYFVLHKNIKKKRIHSGVCLLVMIERCIIRELTHFEMNSFSQNPRKTKKKIGHVWFLKVTRWHFMYGESDN